MIQLLKHTAFRLWFAVMGSGLIGLWVLSFIGPAATLAVSLSITGGLFVILLWFSGWVSNRIGLALVRPLLTEAGVWERSGLPEEAGKRFDKALAVFDSFLLSPGTRRRALPGLIGRIARFYLALPDAPRQAEIFARTYLALHPQDTTFAVAWLDRLEASGGLHAVPDEIIARVGEANPDHPVIQEALAGLYLNDQRTDFIALQTYRRLMDIRGSAPPEMIKRLTRIFLGEGRADEWALSVYLKAASGGKVPEGVLRGIAACNRWLVKTPRNRTLLEAADQHLAHLDALARERMTEGFVPPSSIEREIPALKNRPGISGFLDRIDEQLGRLGRSTAETVGSVFRRTRKVFGTPAASKIVLWTVVTGICLGAIALLINTAGYLRPTRQEPPPEATPQAVKPAPKPFTLQVAAYLKSDYAQKYVETLKKKQLDAYIAETAGDEKTWYQVRISRFADKQSAIDYGEKLKNEGVIEEYYVSNTGAPP